MEPTRTLRHGNDAGYGILAALIDAVCVLTAVSAIAAACAGALEKGAGIYEDHKVWIERLNENASE